MRNRELRAGWGRGDREKAESGRGWGGAYSLAMGWDMRMLGARKEESRPHHPPTPPSQPFYPPKPQQLLFTKDLHGDTYFMNWSVSK